MIIAGNYGEAGAIDYYGPHYGLPSVVSATGTYWFFGPGPKPGDVAVTVGVDSASLGPFFAESRLAARVGDSWSVGEARDVPITYRGGHSRRCSRSGLLLLAEIRC